MAYTKEQIQDMIRQEAKKALAILDRYDKALSTILVGNNIVNIVVQQTANKSKKL